jgi:hypothetical protein
MPSSDFIGPLHLTHPDLARQLAGVTSLEKILAWLQRENRPLDQLDLVAQDEYCHDLLVPLEPDPRWIVFGMT